jgi:HK97 family phage major capsid protein
MGGFHAFADRKGFADAAEKWKAGMKDARWGFDMRFGTKADVDNAAAEVNFGPTTLAGDDGGTDQFSGAVAPYYYPGIIEPPTRQPMIADLFAQGATASNLVRLVKETTTTNSVAATSEGAAYGAVKIEVSPFDWPVRDITGLLPVTEDLLSDIPAMSSYLSMRLSKFVQLAEEQELVSGDGTGNHLFGLLEAADTTTRDQDSDTLEDAVMKLNADVYEASFIDPTWVAMSPTTWATYITAKADTAGIYLAGPVTQAAVRQIWGLPITVSPVIPNDKIIVGNPTAGMIFRNGGLRVESSTGYGTFFGEGLVAIRGKVRTAFTLFRPQAIGVLSLGS